jgi:hypothetical protein
MGARSESLRYRSPTNRPRMFILSSGERALNHRLTGSIRHLGDTPATRAPRVGTCLQLPRARDGTALVGGGRGSSCLVPGVTQRRRRGGTAGRPIGGPLEGGALDGAGRPRVAQVARTAPFRERARPWSQSRCSRWTVREQAGVALGEPLEQRRRCPLGGPLSIEPADEADQFEISRRQAGELAVHHRANPSALDVHVGGSASPRMTERYSSSSSTYFERSAAGWRESPRRSR